MNHSAPASGSPLGKSTAYVNEYNPHLLFSIPRSEKRVELGITNAPPFFGMDVWTAYEISWLNLRGKPQVAIATLFVPADSPNIVESKSLKLYLNSLNQSRIAGPEALLELMSTDLSSAFGAPVQIKLTLSGDFAQLKMAELDGHLIDRLDIEVDTYSPNKSLLRADKASPPIDEKLVSHLLKSNCPVTNQPDWASIQIQYVGPAIDQEGLLKYLIGFRLHQGFHEHCVEQIFMDLLKECSPSKLLVLARYTRRGGIDINPWRSNFSLSKMPSNARNARQ
jgi:7-cyano-7-deazaguanine reductase